MRIFIVDDSDIIVNSLIDSLNDIPGNTVCGQAQDVAGAVNGIVETDPDLVILDLKLQNGTGMDVLEELRDRQLHPTIIVFSNYSLSSLEACLKKGADYVFSKFGDTQSLLDKVAKLCAENMGS